MTTTSTRSTALALLPLGGPTVLIELAGLRLVVDPTFDQPQSYPIGARVLEKTAPNALSVAEIGAIDHVLPSHDQHPDNLDHGGRDLVARTPTLTTVVGAERLGAPATGLAPFATSTLPGRDGAQILVTAVPAQHGPDGTEHLTGPVIGFVLQSPGVPTVYVSGDNASLAVVAGIAERFEVGVAVLFAGAARTPLVDGPLTLTSADAVEATRILGLPRVLAVHTDGWAHFTEDHEVLERAFADAGLAALLLPNRPGRVLEVQ